MSLITPYLYLGDAQNAQDLNFLRSKNISLIVNCTKEIPNFHPNYFKYLNLGLDDIPEEDIARVLIPTAETIINAMKNRKVVLVHCAAGVSRSSSIVIFTLMKLHRWNFDQAYKFVKDLHPRTNPNPGFIEQLVNFNNPMARPGIPINARSDEKNYELIDQEPIQDDNSQSQYQPPGGLYGIRGESQSNAEKKWSKLTLDCPDCELPKYASGGRRGGMYAQIFG